MYLSYGPLLTFTVPARSWVKERRSPCRKIKSCACVPSRAGAQPKYLQAGELSSGFGRATPALYIATCFPRRARTIHAANISRARVLPSFFLTVTSPPLCGFALQRRFPYLVGASGWADEKMGLRGPDLGMASIRNSRMGRLIRFGYIFCEYYAIFLLS